MKLRIGKIPYANLFPIFYTLEKEFDCSSYEFIEEVPSKLNRMLRDGELDISPSSSIEYLKNPSLYQLIDGHSISSKGPVGSILLFSSNPINELNGSIVYVSSQSDTSVALLDILLRKFYDVKCKIKISENPENSAGEAFLLIGDDALKYSNELQVTSNKLKENNSKDSSLVTRHSSLSYDLGEIWHQHMGLPFVFALWIARKDIFEKGNGKLFDKFIRDLNTAREIAMQNLPEIAKHSLMKAYMAEDAIVFYWKMIDYGLTEENKKGLELFEMYLKELSCL